MGENKDSTIIDANWEALIVVTLDSDSILISGFTIQHGNDEAIRVSSNNNIISNNIFGANGDRAIFLYYSDDNKIVNNNLLNASKGITMYNSNSNIIEKNAISNAILSIEGNCNSNQFIENSFYSSGIYMALSANNSFISNKFEDFGYFCLWFDLDCNNNIISNNTILNCNSGINFHACDSNIITENNFINIENRGIYLPDCMCGGCNNNHIYHNNWFNVGNGVYDECSNFWDNGYPSGGNFWNDYSGVDQYSGVNQNIPGSDSIGDTPYVISGGNEQDQYPLMHPFGTVVFAKTEKQWNSLHGSYAITPYFSDTCYGTILHRLGETEEINGLIYYKLYETNDSTGQNWVEIGHIRENESEVFYKPNNEDETLLYNFGLELGEQIVVDGQVLECTSNEIVEYNGVLRKKTELISPISFPVYSATWIEGIGSIYGFFDLLQSNIQGTSDLDRLLCVSEDSYQIYSDSQFANCYYEDFFPKIIQNEYPIAFIDEEYEFQLEIDTSML